EQGFHLATCTLCDGESRCFRQGIGPLACCLTGVYLYDAILAPCALLLLRTTSATFRRRVVEVGSVPLVDANVLQLLACRTEVTVVLGNIGEPVDSIKIVFSQRVLFDPDVRGDTP